MPASGNSRSNRKNQNYRDRVRDLVGQAIDRAQGAEPFSLERGRMVLFSDLHRGARNRADDFQRCERAFNAALAWYYHQGYTLAMLGDVEELWQEGAGSIIGAYEHSMGLEKRFHDEGRYIRVWGNHDDLWRTEGPVKRHLQKVYGDDLQVHEAVCMTVRSEVDGEDVGTLVLTHGHQGTSASDRWSALSRIPVRYVWRPFQRLTGASLNTPANDWELRENHNVALHGAVKDRDAHVLIAGHTHRPVFESRPHAATIQQELEAIDEKLRAAPDDEALRREYAGKAAELEWYRAQENEKTGDEGRAQAGKPCYFNTGCCCFVDGKVTGLEIADGEIRLVRWPDDTRDPKPKVLARAPLRKVLDQCRNAVPAARPEPRLQPA